MTGIKGLAAAALIGTLAGCTGEAGERSLAGACANGLAQAESELSYARANNVGDGVKWTKAAALIGAARVQETFEEYQNCVIKVRDARAYIRAM